MKMKKFLLLFSLLALVAVAGGCIFSPDPEDPQTIGEPDYQPATTPDQLMANFQQIYINMDAAAYASTLHEGYRTMLLQETIDEWAGGDRPLADNYFDRETEITIQTNMFDQLSGLDAHGNIVLPIQSVDVDVMQKLVPWSQVDSSVEYFGQNYPEAYTSRYSVLLHFNLPGSFAYEVDQEVIFYVLKVGDIWQLLGQVGLPNS